MDFFAVKVDGSDVTVGILECFNIRTRHKFEDFCLFSLNSTYSMSITVYYNVRQDILQFFSGISKDYKYVKSRNMS